MRGSECRKSPIWESLTATVTATWAVDARLAATDRQTLLLDWAEMVIRYT
jgi:hypothetical protein